MLLYRCNLLLLFLLEYVGPHVDVVVEVLICAVFVETHQSCSEVASMSLFAAAAMCEAEFVGDFLATSNGVQQVVNALLDKL